MNRKFFVLFFFIIVLLSKTIIAQNNVGINSTGANPNPSAALDVDANDKGVLIPRLTTNQRLAIVNSANGLLVYDTDLKCVFFYELSTFSWISLCDGGGIVGLTGPTGPIGPQGPAGAVGAQGPQGLQGIQGNAGVVGSQGPTGVAGVNGTAGATGPQGPIGVAGTNGLNGTTGPIGLTGATGPQGPAGTAGANGTAGSIGPTGPQGPTGLAGTNGVDGITGPIGLTGAIGPQGVTGIAGTNGINGVTGPTGPVGCANANYIIKSNGATATCTVAPIYEDATGKVGIGNTIPTERVDITGNLRFSNALMPNNLPGIPGQLLKSQGAGVAPVWNWSETYIRSITGTTDISILTTAWTDMAQMTITFTPIKSMVYVMFTCSGYGNMAGQEIAYARIVKDGVVQLGTNNIISETDDFGSIITSWNLAINYPIAVVPGVATTIKIQWRTYQGVATLYNYVVTDPDKTCHRTLMIIE
ncbi:MAG: hypothetical protein WCQ95_06340 [Bacteroidota bacterium]